MSATSKWDVKTLRAAIEKVVLVRHLSPKPNIPEQDLEAQAHYYAGWDDALDVLDRTLRKMTETGA